MIQDSVNKVIYEGNGEATEFFYPFEITKNTDVKVMTVSPDGTEGVLTNDYYVDTERKTVVYPGWVSGEEPGNQGAFSPLADGWKLVIYREVEFTQEVAMFDQYPFKVLEGMIDKNTILAQQLKDETNRSMKLSVSFDNTDIDTTVPYGKGTSFRWSDDGKRLEVTDDPAKVQKVVENIASVVQEQSDAAAESANAAAKSAKNAADSLEELLTLNKAASADKLATPRNINGVAFDGTKDITIDVGVKKVNTLLPDDTGNVNISAIDIGMVVAFAANATPSGGYLICNGAAVNRTTYANLFAKIGTLYGAGDGSTTFNVPNLADKFIMGSDTAGTVKAAGLPNISGDVTLRLGSGDSQISTNWNGAFAIATETSPEYTPIQLGSSSMTKRQRISFNAKSSNSIYGNDTTVQPPAVTMRFYIKY